MNSFVLSVGSGELAKKKIRLLDSCADCSATIEVQIADGLLRSADPPAVWMLQGAG